MNLSGLQKFIIKEASCAKKGVSRNKFHNYYTAKKQKKQDQVKAITKSLERLISKDLVVVYGFKTKEKFYIKEVKLTSAGRKQAKKLLGEQMAMTFNKTRKK